MTEINTITPVAMEDLKYGSDEENTGTVSPEPNSSLGSSSFEKVERPPSSLSDVDDTPLPPGHTVTPQKRSNTPPPIFTTKDGGRGFEVRPRSAYLSPGHAPGHAAHRESGSHNRDSHRLSVISLGKPEYRMSSASPVSHGPRTNGSPEAEQNRRSQYGLVASTEKYVGDAVAPRIETIEQYRKSAAKSHDPDVQFELAQYMVQTALLPEPNAPNPSEKKSKHDLTAEEQTKKKLFRESLDILRKLADKGHPSSQYLLGDILSTTAGGEKPNPKASFHYFLAASKHGHAESAYRAAICLQQGLGTAPDAHRALKMFKTAASRGQPGALFRMGMAYFYAQLGLSDNSTNRLIGLKWLGRAVNAATDIHNQAPYELARIYEQGYRDVVIADLPYAVKLYVRSAELNYVAAALKLGHAYEYGEIGCPQDAVLSIHYYTIAALGGDAQAQYAMCAWYMVGAGPRFPRNEDEAYEWALRSAHAGYPKAQLTLAMFYEKGIGCHRDIFQSTTWYRRAADNGDETALKRLKERNQEEQVHKGKDCVVM